MRLLITGGCGFLGSNLAAEGIRRGMAVTVFDDLSRQGSSSNLAWLRTLGPVTFIHGDIRCASDVQPVVEALVPEVIFHVAGQVAMTTSLANPRRDFEINALGTLNLLESVRRYAPESLIVYSSTNKVYGDLENFTYREDPTRWVCVERPQGFSEETALNFQSPYGCSKGCADQYLLDWHRMYGLKTVVFRHSSMYGGRQFATADQGWIGWFCAQIVRQADPSAEPFTISGTGKQVRDVLHAEDMVSLYFATIEHRAAAVGQVFNVGGAMPNSLSLLELFARLRDMTGVTPRFRCLPPRNSDQRVFVADITKASGTLKWKPVVSCENGLRKMIEWTRKFSQP
jgi:CDP-paratose 2-epimerase